MKGTASSVSRVQQTIRDGVGWITLADPGRRNALDLELAAELAGVVRGLGSEAGVHALVVTGAGSAFCAGADRAVLAEADEALLRAVYDPFLALAASTVPTVAAVNGPAVGAGFNMALACDVRIAAQSARFESRFLQLPIHPGGGHTWMLSRLVGPQAAAAMCVFDQPVDGAAAVRIGLAWSCVPDGELLNACQRFCARIVHSPTPELARAIKTTLHDAQGPVGFQDVLSLELRRQVASTASPVYRRRMAGAARPDPAR